MSDALGTGAIAQDAIGQTSEAVPTIYTLSAVTGAFALTDTGTTVLELPTGLYTLSAVTGAFALTDTGTTVLTHLVGGSASYTLTALIGSFALIDTGTTSLHSNTGLVMADNTSMLDGAYPSMAYTLTSSVTVGGAVAYSFQPVAIVTDGLIATASPTVSAIYGLTYQELLTLNSIITAGYPVSVSSGFTLHDTQTPLVAYLMLERMGFHDTLAGAATYGQVMLDLLKMGDGFYNFFGGTIVDTLRLTDGMMLTYYANASAEDVVRLTDTFANTLYVSALVQDGVEFNDTELLMMIYSGDPLLDRIELFAGYVGPAGDFTTWAINTRTNAVSEYDNWDFNSFAKMGNKYLGASAAGLFELNGNDDAGANIRALVRSGIFQVSGSHLAGFKAAYIGARIKDDAPDVYLRLIADDNKVYTYAVKVRDMKTSRVDFGKGLRHRYYAWELEIPAADFDLDTIEFLPLVMQRRI